MISTPQSEFHDLQLETAWSRGELRAVGQNRRLDMLLEKSDRYDRFWEMADRILNPWRWFQ
jgi:hypothetical protein